MKNRRNFFFYGFYILLGVTLVALGVAEVIDEFWSGMGGGIYKYDLNCWIKMPTCKFTARSNVSALYN